MALAALLELTALLTQGCLLAHSGLHKELYGPLILRLDRVTCLAPRLTWGRCQRGIYLGKIFYRKNVDKRDRWSI